jgi:hypothetical protein
MLSLNDSRWANLTGGYRTQFDPRPLLQRIELSNRVAEAWHSLWENLYHQGDVGDASYAAVPHIVRIYGQQGIIDWNPYAIVATIELARGKGKNPEVPEWLREDYFRAIRELADVGAREILRAKGLDEVRAILSVLAVAKGARTYARFLSHYCEDELLDLEERALQINP